MTLALGIAVFVISVIILIYLFLISPRLQNPADMELLSVNYAHRGLWSANIPENSLAAFELAARHGFGIELDLQLSKDNRIVVFHDDDLSRMCGVNKRVSELTLSELKSLRLGNTNERIPTFTEVLSLIRGRVPLLLEFKGDMPTDALCLEASKLLDVYRGPFCVESFSPMILRWFKKHRPSYARGQLVTKIKKNSRSHSRKLNFVLSRMLTNFMSRPDFIAINQDIGKNLGFIICTRAFHATGFIWTVRDPKAYELYRKKGYTTIFEKFIPKG